MGIIYNDKVNESKIYQAYGLTVYGKVNCYEWTFRNETENVLITIRIVDLNGNDMFSMYMGNRCIFQSVIDITLDNFLWWIAEEHPDNYSIERQVYKSLCASDSLFNYRIQQRKEKQKRQEEEHKRIEIQEEKKNAIIEKIKVYCHEKKFVPFFLHGDIVYIVHPLNEKVCDLFKVVNDTKMIESYIKFMEVYPDNKDVSLVKCGTLEEICDYIS